MSRKLIWSGDHVAVYGTPKVSGRVLVAVYKELEGGDLWPWGGFRSAKYRRIGHPTPISWWRRLLGRRSVQEAIDEVIELAKEAERLEVAKQERKAAAEAALEAATNE